nr:response regulator [Shuttleworthia satelles]
MKYSVIVAEDEILLQEDIIKKINESQSDFEVIGAAQTGPQALDLIEEKNPFLLFTDIRMPIMDGLELIERARETHPHLDVIILSGYPDFSYAQAAIHLQVREYLLKPLSKDRLLESLRALQQDYTLQRQKLNKTLSSDFVTGSAREIADLLKKYLSQHYRQPINLNLVAQHLNYNPNHLTKIYQQYYNTSPSKYLIQLRIQQARQIMDSDPDIPIRAVGEAVGYPDPGYFSRIFKKYTGSSPQKYRETSSRFR